MQSTSQACGGCQCGRIRYRLTAMPKTLYACHCTDCQKQSASAFGMSLIMDPADIEFVSGDGEMRYWDTRGGDGNLKRCYFCPDCGTRIMHASGNAAAPVSIKAGSLDDTRDLKPIAHIWLQSSQGWLNIDRRSPCCFEREPEDKAELTRRWQTQMSTN